MMVIIVKQGQVRTDQFYRNNAGIFSQNLEFSEDKIETTFATNYLGTFLVTDLFLRFILILISLILGKTTIKVVVTLYF